MDLSIAAWRKAFIINMEFQSSRPRRLRAMWKGSIRSCHSSKNIHWRYWTILPVLHCSHPKTCLRQQTRLVSYLYGGLSLFVLTVRIFELEFIANREKLPTWWRINKMEKIITRIPSFFFDEKCFSAAIYLSMQCSLGILKSFFFCTKHSIYIRVLILLFGRIRPNLYLLWKFPF